jgi:hypothetical protein
MAGQPIEVGSDQVSRSDVVFSALDDEDGDLELEAWMHPVNSTMLVSRRERRTS